MLQQRRAKKRRGRRRVINFPNVLIASGFSNISTIHIEYRRNISWIKKIFANILVAWGFMNIWKDINSVVIETPQHLALSKSFSSDSIQPFESFYQSSFALQFKTDQICKKYIRDHLLYIWYFSPQGIYQPEAPHKPTT